jgi:hypothetical protein
MAYAWFGQINGPAGKCIQVSGADPGTHKIMLWSCDASPGVDWGSANDGTLQTLANCMDVTGAGTANNTVVQLWACNGNAAQLWVPRPNGTLANPPSDRVLDDLNWSTADGTTIQIYDDIEVTGGRIDGAQKWALPVAPS